MELIVNTYKIPDKYQLKFGNNYVPLLFSSVVLENNIKRLQNNNNNNISTEVV